jgi:hypothetical protein
MRDLTVAAVLAIHDKLYVDHANKFFEHFFWIAAAMNQMGDNDLWLERNR